MKTKYGKTYDTDDFMRRFAKVITAEIRANQDFVGSYPDPCDRHQSGALPWKGSPLDFKREWQLQNLLKRYRFKDDKYTDDELKRMTFEKFIKLQETRSESVHRSAVVHAVLQKARLLIREILSDYDPEEHVLMCRHGKRAAKGVPASNAYLHEKMAHLSGTPEHIAWFMDVSQDDPHLLRALDDCQAQVDVCYDLQYTTVPKSWKIFRGIVPNTVLGAYYSYGLGRVIQERLRINARLDIRKLQQKHRKLCRSMSKTLKLVTADLSSASDSFTLALVNALLPRKWFLAVKYGLTRHILHDDKRFYCSSFMLMGIGFTFPLQTLLFYAIIRAVQNLCGSSGLVSVYGDDLIYPTDIHKHVSYVLSALGFQLNMDKTFVDLPFRESCGADFFKGVDVRPFQPEGQHEVMVGLHYEAWLYKIYNGLTARWPGQVLTRTKRFIILEILRCTTDLKLAANDAPDYSGLKGLEYKWYLPVNLLWCEDWQTIVCKNIVVRPVPKVLARKFQSAYYWEHLRQADSRHRDEGDYGMVPILTVRDGRFVLDDSKPGCSVTKHRKFSVQTSDGGTLPRDVLHVPLKGSSSIGCRWAHYDGSIEG
mgnify:CR=1 FL=1